MRYPRGWADCGWADCGCAACCCAASGRTRLVGVREAQATNELLEARVAAQALQVGIVEEVVDIVVAEDDGLFQSLEGLKGALGQGERAGEVVLDRRILGEDAGEPAVELESALPMALAREGLGELGEGFEIVRLPARDDLIELD